MDVILPDGFISDLGMVFDHVKIGELTGKQQNYLTDIDNLQSGLSHIDKLLKDLVLEFWSDDGSKFMGSKDDALKRISTNDIETILIKIREATFGPTYLFKAICPHCEAENDLKLDLSKLEITQSPKDQKGKALDIILPKSQQKAQLKLMGLEALHKSFTMFQKHKSELVTTTAAMVLGSLGEKKNPQPKDLENLPIMDIKYINDKFQEIGGKIDTDVIHECKKCKKEFPTKLNVISPNFYSLG
jgi:hypothetical protein